MYGTALQIAQQAASELGLPQPDIVVSSTDQNARMFWALMNSAGGELLTYWDWQDMLKEAAIVAVANQAFYPRPSDFLRQLNQTIWDEYNRRPVIGPVSPQGWQALQNSAVSVGPYARYRIMANQVELNPVPTSNGHTYSYNYISQNWVQSGANPNVRLPLVQADGDTPLFDFWLMVKFLKLKMWQAKGLDTTAFMQDFLRVYNQITGQDIGAPVLSLSPRFVGPYISIYNVPDGNWNPVTGS